MGNNNKSGRKTVAWQWFQSATEEDIVTLKLDRELVRQKKASEEEFKKKYGFGVQTADSYTTEDKTLDENTTISANDILADSISRNRKFTRLTLELSEDTVENIRTVCKKYKEAGIKAKVVQDYIIFKAFEKYM